MYATKADILSQVPEEKLVQLTTDSGDQIDDVVLNDILVKTDGEIDSYLRVRYEVPVNPIPPEISQAAVVIAKYRLYHRRTDFGVSEGVDGDYAKTIAWLSKIASGSVILSLSSATPTPGAAEFKANPRTMTKDSLKGW
jgi:phage gp36-like protein